MWAGVNYFVNNLYMKDYINGSYGEDNKCDTWHGILKVINHVKDECHKEKYGYSH